MVVLMKNILSFRLHGSGMCRVGGFMPNSPEENRGGFFKVDYCACWTRFKGTVWNIKFGSSRVPVFGLRSRGALQSVGSGPERMYRSIRWFVDGFPHVVGSQLRVQIRTAQIDWGRPECWHVELLRPYLVSSSVFSSPWRGIKNSKNKRRFTKWWFENLNDASESYIMLGTKRSQSS